MTHLFFKACNRSWTDPKTNFHEKGGGGRELILLPGIIKHLILLLHIHPSKYIVYLSVHMPIVQVLFHIPALKTYETLKIKTGYVPLH